MRKIFRRIRIEEADFSAPEALEIYKKFKLDCPFIIVSGGIGERTAVASLKAGAHDCFFKGNLNGLVASIENELHNTELRIMCRRIASQIGEANIPTTIFSLEKRF